MCLLKYVETISSENIMTTWISHWKWHLVCVEGYRDSDSVIVPRDLWLFGLNPPIPPSFIQISTIHLASSYICINIYVMVADAFRLLYSHPSPSLSNTVIDIRRNIILINPRQGDPTKINEIKTTSTRVYERDYPLRMKPGKTISFIQVMFRQSYPSHARWTLFHHSAHSVSVVLAICKLYRCSRWSLM